MPASSKMDVLLPKARPIRNGKTSVITYLKRQKSNCADAIVAREEWTENMGENNPADTKVTGEGGGGGAPGPGAEIPLQPRVQPMVRQLCPWSPWRITGMQRSICSPCRRPMPEQEVA
ncbi:hypothetical protein HGM15179_013212 [Zosterops borbonicus]|uniref:Uncharacterized protein n=1 Tax=Zosterops borbonicus TaxID=364589 RepID=A0A8K1G8S5_9PASS|nr:hypothetical protein HGM15179_013212 [Zosterops borbonicus]